MEEEMKNNLLRIKERLQRQYLLMTELLNSTQETIDMIEEILKEDLYGI